VPLRLGPGGGAGTHFSNTSAGRGLRSWSLKITAAAERDGLLGGFRKAKREHILIQCAGFWIAAAAALYWAPAQP